MLSDFQIIRRMRYKLNRCGLKLHKWRGRDAYTVLQSDADTDEGRVFGSLTQLVDFVEILDEKRRSAAQS